MSVGSGVGCDVMHHPAGTQILLCAKDLRAKIVLVLSDEVQFTQISPGIFIVQ